MPQCGGEGKGKIKDDSSEVSGSMEKTQLIKTWRWGVELALGEFVQVLNSAVPCPQKATIIWLPWNPQVKPQWFPHIILENHQSTRCRGRHGCYLRENAGNVVSLRFCVSSQVQTRGIQAPLFTNSVSPSQHTSFLFISVSLSVKWGL